jgi:hypothetical protein
MTDEEFAELEAGLVVKLRQITALKTEAEEMAERILAERERRRTPAARYERR